MAVFKHFIRKIQHSDVKLNPQCLTNIGQIVEEIRIPAAKVHRYHITFCLYALYHKCFFPFQITNHSVITTRAQPGGKHDQLIIGLESGFHHFREVLRLLPCFINRNTKRSKSAQVHQQVIYQIFHFSVIVTPQHIAQRNSVLSAQRMIGNESIQPVFGKILNAFHIYFCVQKAHTCF